MSAPQPTSLPGRSLWLPSAIAACFVYGLLLIALIHTTADGSWFWYAQALTHGQHLYRELHLAMQPVYPLELASLQRLLGTTWIAQQSAGLVNLVLFLIALWAVTRHNHTSPLQRALLLACSFLTAIGFISMRFDDFHILATSLELLCAALLLSLAHRQPSTPRRILALVAIGVLCGLCILTRLNDGSLLLFAVLVSAVAIAHGVARHIEALLTIAGVSALTLLLVLTCIGETPRDWWFYSIHTAAAIKGGAGHLWQYPLRLPVGTVREITRDWRNVVLTAYALILGAIAVYLTRNRHSLSTRRRWILVLFALVLALPLSRNIIRGNAARVLVAFAVFGIYIVGIATLVRLVRALRGRPAPTWRPIELLMLIPAAQLISISLSAALWYPNPNPPAALFLILLPVGAPWAIARRDARNVFFTWVVLLTISAGIDKLRNPFDWFNYRARSFDAERTWYPHPAFGPMLIETAQLRLMLPVCAAVDAAPPSQRELLSLPFTYPNYFCDIPPWHGYTQTFYDTSSRATITALGHELLTAPPEWIVYQRQLDILFRNEEAFNHGQPLPHRELDTLIMDQLATHRWTATTLPAPPRDSSTWLLIHTRP
ncbi:hypothetical protein [Terriglobus sp.]|uniref:hypothetical protein n=1 Tax=Terriglobus sp. TaxID=1889013 RepID=UPI003AFF81D7